MSKKMLVLAALVMVVGLIVAPIAPASAGTVTGGLGFTCTATLPAFPTSSGSGATCTGTSVGAVAGQTDGGAPYVVAGPGTINAFNINYAEGCVANEPPLLGTANGQAVIDVTTGSPGTVTAGFDWTRIGLVAVVLTNNTTVTSAAGTATATVQPGAGVAAFAPLLTASNVCPTGGPLTAIVAGALGNAV
jgi:hypothetical protein